MSAIEDQILKELIAIRKAVGKIGVTLNRPTKSFKTKVSGQDLKILLNRSKRNES